MGRSREKGFLYMELLVSIAIFMVLLTGAIATIPRESSSYWEVKVATEILLQDLQQLQQQIIYGRPGKGDALPNVYIFGKTYASYTNGQVFFLRDFPPHVRNESGTYRIVFARDGRPSKDTKIVLSSSDKKWVGIIYIAVQTGRMRVEVKKRNGHN